MNVRVISRHDLMVRRHLMSEIVSKQLKWSLIIQNLLFLLLKFFVSNLDLLLLGFLCFFRFLSVTVLELLRNQTWIHTQSMIYIYLNRASVILSQLRHVSRWLQQGLWWTFVLKHFFRLIGLVSTEHGCVLGLVASVCVVWRCWLCVDVILVTVVYSFLEFIVLKLLFETCNIDLFSLELINLFAFLELFTLVVR